MANETITANETKIWDGPFHFLSAAATSAGVDKLECSITVSGTDSEPNAIRMCADLAKLGAPVTRDGETLTVHVGLDVALKFFDIQVYGGETVGRPWTVR